MPASVRPICGSREGREGDCPSLSNSDFVTARNLKRCVQVEFAADSPLEGDGFEPSVPGTKEPVFVAEGELRDRTGAAKKGCFLCGTDGSNPPPSSGESAANPRTFRSRRRDHFTLVPANTGTTSRSSPR